MSSTDKATIIYPFFDGQGIQVDLYANENDTEALGSADFPLEFLADEFISEFANEEGRIVDIEACEYAYALIDALRTSANKLAAVLDVEDENDE